MKNKNLKLIIAIILGWSAPIISFIIWLWLMHREKYQEYSIPKKTMWIVFWVTLSPIIIGALGVLAINVYDSISPITKEPALEVDTFHYTLTSVELPTMDYNIDMEDGQRIETINANNEIEFIESLGSNRIINLTNNIDFNLSEVLLDEALFSAYGREYINEPCVLKKDTTYVFSETIYNGRELTLYRIKNLTIRSTSGAKIIVDYPDATVMEFINCENIKLENLTFGHNTDASCVGQVIGIDRCKDVTIQGCDLYGCGAYGILAYNSSNILVEQSIIRDCSNGIMWLSSCKNTTYKNCKFLRNRQFELITIDGESENIFFENCIFENNEGPLFSLSSPINLKSCKIVHDINNLGDFNSERIVQLDQKTILQHHFESAIE